MSELPPNAISACVVVRNQDDVIGRCLDSLNGVVDEVVLVHSGPCRDRTVDIARERGCRVIMAEDGGSGEYNTPLAYSAARGEWLLNIDADEFLSDELRANLRRLTADEGVDGYSFIWPLWNGTRYVTREGPYKMVLFRRAKTRMLGLSHAWEQVEGVVREMPFVLEHRPASDAFALRTLRTHWREQAQVQAREYVSELTGVPRFNYPDDIRWSRRRRLTNRLAPLMIVPAAVHTFIHIVRHERHRMSPPELARFALLQALYRGMVTAYVARYRWRRR